MQDTDRVHRQPPPIPPLRARAARATVGPAELRPAALDHGFFDRTPTTAPPSQVTPHLEDAATTPFPRFARGTLRLVPEPGRPDAADPVERAVGLRHARLALPLPLPVKLIDTPRRWGRVVSLNRPVRRTTRTSGQRTGRRTGQRTLRPAPPGAAIAGLEPSSAAALALAVLASLSLVLAWLYWLLP